MRKYVFGIASLVVAFALGATWQRWSEPDVAEELRRLRAAVGASRGAAVPKPAGPVVIPGAVGVSREELREELNNALQALRAEEGKANDAEGSERREPEPLTPEMEAVRDEANEFVEAAMLRGTWHAGDRAELHRLADQITDTQTQFELFRRLSAAINDGILKPELDGPLL